MAATFSSVLAFSSCFFLARAFSIADVTLGTGKQVKFERATHCPGSEKENVIGFHVNKMRTSGNKIFTNATIVIKRDVRGDVDVVIELQRCRSKESLDTCESFHSFRIDKFCNAMNSLAAFQSMQDTIKPKFQCPFRKGKYVAKDMEQDVSYLSFLPADGSYYKMKVETFTVEEKPPQRLGCLIFEARVVNVKGKN